MFVIISRAICSGNSCCLLQRAHYFACPAKPQSTLINHNRFVLGGNMSTRSSLFPLFKRQLEVSAVIWHFLFYYLCHWKWKLHTIYLSYFWCPLCSSVFCPWVWWWRPFLTWGPLLTPHWLFYLGWLDRFIHEVKAPPPSGFTIVPSYWSRPTDGPVHIGLECDCCVYVHQKEPCQQGHL